MRSCQGKARELIKNKTRKVKKKIKENTEKELIAKLTQEVFKREIDRREWEEEKKTTKFKTSK